MKMKIGKRLGDQAVSKILHQNPGVPLGEHVKHFRNHAVLQHKVSGGMDFQFSQGRSGDENAL
jgi:hypothetical protein